MLEDKLRGETRLTGTPPDVHHETQGYRTGHNRTAFCCPYHHRGIVPAGESIQSMFDVMGPSLAIQPQQFRDRYGSDAYLIAVCDSEIEKREAQVVR
jgi:hypothetical protein